jgi:hypothetical protein
VTAPIQHHSDVHLINVISITAGVWFIMSPAAFGLAPWDVFDWNNLICGALVIAAGIAGLVQHRCMPPYGRWIVGLVGAWITASPWIFGYADDWDRLLNTVAVGAVLIFAAARCAPARS